MEATTEIPVPMFFFQEKYNRLVDSPNGSPFWWHSMPLPNGDRIKSNAPDKDLQFKMWRAMQIEGLSGKHVLDIGANDGFFSLAAAMSGAAEVTSIDKDWFTWPANIRYASEIWNSKLKIVTGDFRTFEFERRYDVILFLGVLYHLEDVFVAMNRLSALLENHGALYIETQMSQIESALPLFEFASDIYPTVATQDKGNMSSSVGLSNYLFPNVPAMRNLAYLYDFGYENLAGPCNDYSRENPTRQLFKFTKIA
jgi:2-polyprenyl-3-methyl-5-hydroxy-6-metoxy-1,4-benzoquinol methylase